MRRFDSLFRIFAIAVPNTKDRHLACDLVCGVIELMTRVAIVTLSAVRQGEHGRLEVRRDMKGLAAIEFSQPLQSEVAIMDTCCGCIAV